MQARCRSSSRRSQKLSGTDSTDEAYADYNLASRGSRSVSART